MEEAFTPHITSDDRKVKYGYGWMIGELEGWRTLEHSGSTIGFRNFMLRIPERSLFVVVLMNRADGPAEQLAREIASKVLRARLRIPQNRVTP
jgi:CubicO group peptidase (beta-lactamase class C family)